MTVGVAARAIKRVNCCDKAASSRQEYSRNIEHIEQEIKASISEAPSPEVQKEEQIKAAIIQKQKQQKIAAAKVAAKVAACAAT